MFLCFQRRSAVAERIRLREEWTALKRLSNAPGPSTTRQTIQPLNKKPHNIHKNMVRLKPLKEGRKVKAIKVGKGGCDFQKYV